LIKAAVVNAHFLAMLLPTCLHQIACGHANVVTGNRVTMTEYRQCLYLYKCHLHSNIHILDEQRATFARWERPGGHDEIEAAITEGRVFHSISLNVITDTEIPEQYA